MRHDDESWNPRARVGKVLPKTDRPIREGTKRPAVERVLEAAALRRAQDPVRKLFFFFPNFFLLFSFKFYFTATQTILRSSDEAIK